MRDAVLAALFRKGPSFGLEIKLRPLRRTDLTQPRSGQQEQFRELAERIAGGVESHPGGPDLIIGQDAIASRLDARRPDLVARRGFDEPALFGP